MAAPRIRIEYDSMNQISKRFSRQSEGIGSLNQRVASQVEVLRGGDWVGQGANVFYQEMDDEILPALKRLSAVLGMGDRVTQGLIQVMHDTDEELANLLQLFGAGGVAGAIGVIAGVGAVGGTGGSGVAGGASWQQANQLLVRDPSSLFTQSKLQGLIGLQFQGAGAELGNAMRGLLAEPSGAKANKLIIIIINLRGRPAGEIQVEFEKFQEVMEQRDATNPETPPSGGGGGNASHMGSMTQMRYGSVVGEAFGIDPTFGAMLNPSGGLIGPGNWAFAGADTAVGYHQISHDAGGYLHNYHKIGPGYDYLGSGSGSPSDPATGQSAGISFWRQTVGGSTSSSTQGPLSMGGQVGGINRLSQSLDRVGRSN